MTRTDLITRLRNKALLSQVVLGVFIASCIVTFFSAVFTVGSAAGRDFDETKVFLLVALTSASLAAYTWFTYGQVASAVKRGWMEGYGGTEWLTPAGERGRCVGFEDVCGLRIVLGFEAGAKSVFNLGDLLLADPAMTRLLPLQDGPVFARPRDYVSILGVLPLSTIALALLPYYFGSGPWSDASLAVTIAVGCLFIPVFLVVSDLNTNDSGSDALLKEYSKYRWKAEDGEIGMIRSVHRHSDSDNRNIHVDYLTVGFPSGVRRIERARLIPA